MTVQTMQFPPMKMVVSGMLILSLGGCATFSGDEGVDAVSALTSERIGQKVTLAKSGNDNAVLQAEVSKLLAEPLTADTAVHIALINNRALQVSLAELGVAEADWVQAGRMRNPGFSFSRMRGGDVAEIDRSIMFDLAGLLTLPIRSNIERGRFEQAKLQAASDAVRLAADTRLAYFNAVAAQQSVQYLRQVQASAEAGAELAQRMAQVGNFSKLDAARQQVFYADATAQLARAQQDANTAREQLTRLLGLWDSNTAFALPDRLPDIPAAAPEMQDAEVQAIRQRLDVQMARRDTEATASALGLTRATRFVNVLNAGYINKSESGKPRLGGYDISLEIPLFDWGAAKTRKAESLYMASVHRTADTAIRARSEVRQAYLAYRTSYDLARHYRDEVVPLRKKISDEVLLRYNGMLASAFELLADAREQAGTVNAAIDAQRNYWLADTDLQFAINGSGGMPTATHTAATPAATPAQH